MVRPNDFGTYRNRDNAIRKLDASRFPLGNRRKSATSSFLIRHLPRWNIIKVTGYQVGMLDRGQAAIVIITASHYAEHSAHSASLGTQIAHFYGNGPALMAFKERNRKSSGRSSSRNYSERRRRRRRLFDAYFVNANKTHRCAAMIDPPMELESISP